MCIYVQDMKSNLSSGGLSIDDANSNTNADTDDDNVG